MKCIFNVFILNLMLIKLKLFFFFLSLLFSHSRPLRICPWALVEWTKVDPRHSHLMVTTCPLMVWSVVALQPLTCRTRWMDRCLVSEPSPWNFPPSYFRLPFSSLSHLGCLATPQKYERGPSTVQWCHHFASFGGPGLILWLMMLCIYLCIVQQSYCNCIVI